MNFRLFSAVLCGLLCLTRVFGQGGQANLASATVSTLPTASTHAGQTYVVTDSAVGCTTGGGAGYVMCKSNGVVWIVVGSGGSPGGSDTQVQFNDANAFGGDAGLVYNKTTDTLTGVELIASGHLAVGPDAAIAPNFTKLWIEDDSFTYASGQPIPFYLDVEATPSFDNASFLGNLTAIGIHGTHPFNRSVGTWGETTYFGSGTAVELDGLFGNTTVDGNVGAVGAMAGIRIQNTIDSTGSPVANLYDAYFQTPNGATATTKVTNSYAVYIEDHSSIGTTLSYNFYSAGATSKNKFEGDVEAKTFTFGGGTPVTKVLSATASLDFTALSANSCEEFSITVTGAADGDTVSLGVPAVAANGDAKATVFGFVSAPDTVLIRRCNVTGTSTTDPAAATVRATVTKF